jgi:hypothetical protein
MTEHVYVGWAVTLANGNVVNFTDQREALRYFGDHDTTEMNLTQNVIQCGLERGRSFCGHCAEATYTR